MKREHKYILIGGLFLLTIAGSLLLWWFLVVSKRTEIVFLNVGQGDAILISQGSSQVLIDAGKNGKDLLSHLGRYVPFWDRHIEFVIATHPDADHIGGFPSLLRSYTVDRVLTSGATSDTEVSKLFASATEKYSVEKSERIFRGTTLEFPSGGVLKIEYPLLPTDTVGGDTNASSVVARFEYGETSFLLTGDLPREETVLPEEQAVTVLKAAHHGSKYSTSANFLDLVLPKEAIISVGKNTYGHPDMGVLDRLRERGVIIRRTDTDGDIRYRCIDSLSCRFVPY